MGTDAGKKVADEKIMECIPNFDLENIITPVNWEVLRDMLHEVVCDSGEIKFLVDGFSKGFEIGYEGPQERQQYAKNLPIKCGSAIQHRNKMVKDVNLRRFAGPYEEIPFDNFVQSPTGLVPKAGGQTRLVLHLSWPEKNSI